jgi:hypothetical protein
MLRDRKMADQDDLTGRFILKPEMVNRSIVESQAIQETPEIHVRQDKARIRTPL